MGDISFIFVSNQQHFSLLELENIFALKISPDIFLLPRMKGKKIKSEKYKIYIFESYLVWRMQFMILKDKKLCCVCREFLTFNAY